MSTFNYERGRYSNIDDSISDNDIRARIAELQRFDKLTQNQSHDLRDLEHHLAERERTASRAKLSRALGVTPGALTRHQENGDALDLGNVNPAATERVRETGTSATNAPRDNARRTLDALRTVPDEGKERLTRSFEAAEVRSDGGAELGILSRWLLATSSPAYARAVGKMFRDPENGHREFDAEELDAYRTAKTVQRAMAIGTDSAGGFMLPTHLDPAIMLTNAGVIDPIRALARTELISTNEWNGISSAGVTASWDAEAAEVSDDSPTLAQPSVPVHKGAAFVAASIEAAQDTRIGDQVAALFIDAKLRLEGAAFLTGSGSGQPTGLITSLGAGQKVATASADALVSADVTKPAVALPPRWQPNARYIANNATAIAIGAFETTGGSLRYPEINGTPSTLLRKGFHEHSGMSTAGAVATAGNDNVLLLGSFDQYLVVDRVGATIEYIPHLFGVSTPTNRPTGQRGWYMYWRTGGAALIADAFRLLTA